MTSQRTHPAHPLLELRNLSISFRDRRQIAVDRVSFSVLKGQTLGLVGASGAGKSSVARAILRLVQADGGEILFKGEDIHRMKSQQLMAARQRIQIVFQEPSRSLSPKRTVAESLLEPLQHFAIGSPTERSRKVKKILLTVGLDHDVLHHYPHQFSTGQKQRIAIARALVTKPDLVIADEAVSSLDVSVQAQILQLIQTLQAEYGIAFLFISHDLAVIRQIADGVAVMYRGQLLEQAPADTFFSQPAHPYSRLLLSLASLDEPSPVLNHQQQLNPDGITNHRPSACVYSAGCAEVMPVCGQSEPARIEIKYKNQNMRGSHCVRCHLYDETNINET